MRYNTTRAHRYTPRASKSIMYTDARAEWAMKKGLREQRSKCSSRALARFPSIFLLLFLRARLPPPPFPFPRRSSVYRQPRLCARLSTSDYTVCACVSSLFLLLLLSLSFNFVLPRFFFTFFSLFNLPLYITPLQSLNRVSIVPSASLITVRALLYSCAHVVAGIFLFFYLFLLKSNNSLALDAYVYRQNNNFFSASRLLRRFIAPDV